MRSKSVETDETFQEMVEVAEEIETIAVTIRIELYITQPGVSGTKADRYDR